MSPLPDVHGTTGNIDILLDSSILDRFASLPQGGEFFTFPSDALQHSMPAAAACLDHSKKTNG